MWVAAALTVLLLAFRAGMVVGYARARFAYRWGENYHRNFGGPRGGFFGDFYGKDFIEAHGAFGQIIKIDFATSTEQSATLVMNGRDNVEKIVLVKADTALRRAEGMLGLGDLKAGDDVVVIGDPNERGQIEAKFIRVLPVRSAGAASPKPFFWGFGRR